MRLTAPLNDASDVKLNESVSVTFSEEMDAASLTPGTFKVTSGSAATRGRFAEVLGSRPQARILMEASTESEWVARCLEALRHEVVVADPNFSPMYTTRS